MRRNDTHQRQRAQRDDCIRGEEKNNNNNRSKIAPEGKRLRQTEMMEKRESQLELGAQTATTPRAMATGSATRNPYGCLHLRVQPHLPFPLMP